jgi:hypothetical protein
LEGALRHGDVDYELDKCDVRWKARAHHCLMRIAQRLAPEAKASIADERIALPVVSGQTITFEGVDFNGTGEQARLVAAVVDVSPEFFPASKDFSKPSVLLKSLPEHLKQHIEAKPGKGYRWVKR